MYLSVFLTRLGGKVKANNIVGLRYHWVIDISVKGSLLHGREVVQLQQPRFHGFIQKEINSKQFVATVVTGGFLVKD